MIEWAERFQQHRAHLRAVAFRMLGSTVDADDAVQEAWLRIRDQDPDGIENMQAWLTTVVGRVCLNMLRSRRARCEQRLDAHVPDPVVTFPDAADPEQRVVLADSVALALLVVLDSLAPDERLAFVRAGADQWNRRSGHRSSRQAVRGHGVHRRGRADHGDRRACRPRTTRAAAAHD